MGVKLLLSFILVAWMLPGMLFALYVWTDDSLANGSRRFGLFYGVFYGVSLLVGLPVIWAML